MGRSAQVESMRQQVQARDAEIQRLQRELAHVREMAELVEGNLECAKAELAEHEAVFTLTMPIIDAAVELTRINDSCQWADSTLTDDLTEVSTEHYGALFTAVSKAYTTVTAVHVKSA
jgi:chromosome segregation ATPase